MSNGKDKKKSLFIVISTFLLVCLFILVALVLTHKSPKEIQDSKEKKEKKAEESRRPQYVAPPALNREALVLMHECYTPCNANIQWRFKIRTDGQAIRVKFQGVKDWFIIPAEGDVQCPQQLRSGMTEFQSNEKNPHIRVQVYQKITY